MPNVVELTNKKVDKGRDVRTFSVTFCIAYVHNIIAPSCTACDNR